jgi:hypothetical protein
MLMSQTPLRSLDFGTFQNRLTDFVDTAEAWMDYLAGKEPTPESNDGQVLQSGPNGPLMRV